MSRRLRLGLAVAAAALLGVLVARVPSALADLEFFRVDGIRIEGTRFLDPSVARAALSLPPGAGVWDDPEGWVDGLRSHVLVDAVEVHRALPDSLVIEVTERQPVAMVPTPTLEPVDEDGFPLPIDPSRHRLDLPLVRVEDGLSLGRMSALRVRPLTRELKRLGHVDPSFLALVSEVGWDGSHDAVVLWGDPAVTIRFRPPLLEERLRLAVSVMSDAGRRFPERRLRAVDLRYTDQVIVRF